MLDGSTGEKAVDKRGPMSGYLQSRVMSNTVRAGEYVHSEHEKLVSRQRKNRSPIIQTLNFNGLSLKNNGFSLATISPPCPLSGPG